MTHIKEPFILPNDNHIDMTKWNDIIDEELAVRMEKNTTVHNQDLVFWLMSKHGKTEKTANILVTEYSNNVWSEEATYDDDVVISNEGLER